MNQLVEVVFLGQQWAEAHLPNSDEAMVSITDHGKPDADLNSGWYGLLRTSFDDIDPFEYPPEPGEGLIEIQAEQAAQIAEFVNRMAKDVKVIIVHCKYGQSRSAGVAKAIAEHYGLEFPQDYEYENKYVYSLVLKSLQQRGGA